MDDDIMIPTVRAFVVLTVVLLICTLIWITGLVAFGMFDKETEEFLRTYEVTNNTALSVDNVHGRVKITSWDTDTVRVHATKITYFGREMLDRLDIEVNKDNATGTMLIRAYEIHKYAWAIVNFDIYVPVDVTVNNVECSNGVISLEETRGNATLNTDNGKITVRDHSGNIKASTSNGYMSFKNIDGSVTCESSNAQTRITNISGTADVKTSNGGVEITQAQFVSRAHSSNGDIQVQFSDIHPAGTDLKTSNGDIDVRFPAGIQCSIRAHTSNGRVKTHDFNNVLLGKSSTSLLGPYNGGGPTFSLDTSNGDIDLYAQEALP